MDCEEGPRENQCNWRKTPSSGRLPFFVNMTWESLCLKARGISGLLCGYGLGTKTMIAMRATGYCRSGDRKRFMDYKKMTSEIKFSPYSLLISSTTLALDVVS